MRTFCRKRSRRAVFCQRPCGTVSRREESVCVLFFFWKPAAYAEKALPYACAVEFIHTYSLIHDDHPSMDDDDYRRGKLTNHKVFGDGMAILAGDGLLNSAFDVMMEDILPAAGRGEDVSFLLRAAYEISSSAGVRGMIAGQAADLQNTGNGYRQDAKFAGNLQGKRTTVRERCAAADSEAGAGTVREELSGGEEGREKMLLYIHKKKTHTFDVSLSSFFTVSDLFPIMIFI